MNRKRGRDRTYAERRRRSIIVANWIKEHGYVCPGYERDAHTAYDLTADHLWPRSVHGDRTPLQVLCRSCNSRKGAQELDGGGISTPERQRQRVLAGFPSLIARKADFPSVIARKADFPS